MLMWDTELAVACRHRLNEIECWRCAASLLPERTNLDSFCSGDFICSKNVICLAPKIRREPGVVLLLLRSPAPIPEPQWNKSLNRVSDLRKKTLEIDGRFRVKNVMPSFSVHNFYPIHFIIVCVLITDKWFLGTYLDFWPCIKSLNPRSARISFTWRHRVMKFTEILLGF